jgi:histidine triad (HIT) family protein
MKVQDCIFCKISAKEISALILLESENFISLLDIHPHAPGHTIVITKDHIVNFTDLPLVFAEEFVKISQETMKLLQRGLKAENFTIGINEGSLAGRAVPHLHLHILPRFKGDSGGSIHSVVMNPPRESVENIYKQLMG